MSGRTTEACEGLVWVGKLIMEGRRAFFVIAFMLVSSFLLIRELDGWLADTKVAVARASDNFDKWKEEHAPPDYNQTCRFIDSALDCTLSAPSWNGPPIRLYCDKELCKVGGP